MRHGLKQSSGPALLLTAVLAGLAPSMVFGDDRVLDAIESDPARLGRMVGSPPPPHRILRFDDGSYFRFPELRWSVSHFRELMPTVNISRGLGAPLRLGKTLSMNPQAQQQIADKCRRVVYF